MSTLKLTTLSNQGGTASVPSETVINGTAKAWVNFNGQGTPAITASFNVSSITDNGTGDYTLNFTTAFSDTKYAAVASDQMPASNNYGSVYPAARTTSTLRIYVNYNGTVYDAYAAQIAIFR
jgi:hypothetical protein